MTYDEYKKDLRERIASPDDRTAWAAFREAHEFFDGEREIEAAAKARFFANRRAAR